MPKQARPWPNNQKEYRDRAAEEINEALKILLPLLDKRNWIQEEIIWRTGKAIHHLHNAARWLKEAGAPTLPT